MSKTDRSATLVPAVGAQVERGVRPLAWTEALGPMPGVPYNHCAAPTPFGRFLITWKGWKDSPCYVADETPWHEFYGAWDSLDEAQRECEKEFSRRLTLCLAA